MAGIAEETEDDVAGIAVETEADGVAMLSGTGDVGPDPELG